MPQFVDWKKTPSKTKRIKVCDGWRFLKKGVEIFDDDMTFENGKWVSFKDDIPETVQKNMIVIRKISGADLSDLEPDKTVRIAL